MKKDENISEEQLNAFVDGELETEEVSGLFDEAEQSADLDQRICKQRKLKELVKHAYRDIPEPKRLLPGSRMTGSTVGLALVASAILVLGAVTGLLLHGFLEHDPLTGGYALTGKQSTAAATAENYIVHVASGNPEQMKRALQRVSLLLSSADSGSPRQVEVVANEKGLDLLRSDVTRFSNEISYLASEHVVFYACSKSIQRLEDKGIVVKLVPEAIPGYTALDRVVLRMNDGWQYIKI